MLTIVARRRRRGVHARDGAAPAIILVGLALAYLAYLVLANVLGLGQGP